MGGGSLRWHHRSMEEITSERRLDHLKDAARKLDREGLLRFRAWICAEFDGCGFSRRSERAEFAALYSIRDFEHEDMREYLAFAPRTTRFTAWTAPGIYAIASDRDWLYVGRATRLSLRRTGPHFEAVPTRIVSFSAIGMPTQAQCGL